MIIEIDQSGKVEDTAVDTVVAFSNHICRSILITAKEKRKIQTTFRFIGKPRMFVYRVFAVLIFLLIKDIIRDLQAVIIDYEYYGQERIIKHELLELIRAHKRYLDKQAIAFRSIGKKHRAHITALATFRRNRKTDLQVNAEGVLSYIL